MTIIKTFVEPYFKEKSRILGNCYIICDQNVKHHYEVIPQNKSAKILSDTDQYLEEIANAHHQENPDILFYYTDDHTFTMHFEEIHIFKLPISILQVTKLFLNETYLAHLRNYLDVESICIPVEIIDDEYVILDKHHEVFLAAENGIRMINVYMSTPTKDIQNVLYLAKEQNIRTVQNLKLLSSEEYELITKQLEALFPFESF